MGIKFNKLQKKISHSFIGLLKRISFSTHIAYSKGTLGYFVGNVLRTIPAAIVLIIILILLKYNVLGRVQDTLSDQFLYQGSTEKEVVILAIDDASIQEFGRWPWDREVFANIQSKLENFNLKVIAWDLSFTETSEHDNNFAEALNSETPVVLAYEISPQWQSGYLPPLSEFQKDNVGIGYFNLDRDSDGKIRATSLFETDRNQKCHKSLALVVYEESIGKTFEDPCENGLEEIPLEDGNRLIVNYAGPPGTLQHVSVADFLKYDVIPESLKDKIVIIGVTARSIQAYKLISADSSLMSGVEIMGNVVHTLKSGDFIYRQKMEYQILSLFAISFLAVLVMRFQKVLMGSVVIFGIINLYMLYAIWNLSSGQIMDLTYLPVAGLALWVTELGVNFYMNKQEEEYIRGAFEHYVSKKVLHEIIRDKEKLSLGGDSRTLTVLFSDLRNFTSFSEKIPAKELVDLMNEYLTKMSSVILDEDGFIDKYIGDEIMAFWGAPIHDESHAYHACKAALRMMKELQNWKRAKGYTEKDFNIGIGINTGVMIVGNMGSHERFSYTVLGDSVNLGSRIEGLTKTYRVPIIISEYTYDVLKQEKKIFDAKNKKTNALVVRELDMVKVKGRNEPVGLYELVGVYQDSKKHLNAIEKFERALTQYRNSNWNDAREIFTELAKTDPAAEEFITRIKFLQKRNMEKWDGIWEMQTK